MVGCHDSCGPLLGRQGLGKGKLVLREVALQELLDWRHFINLMAGLSLGHASLFEGLHEAFPGVTHCKALVQHHMTGQSSGSKQTWKPNKSLSHPTPYTLNPTLNHGVCGCHVNLGQGSVLPRETAFKVKVSGLRVLCFCARNMYFDCSR